jgi:hypothetical protein
MLPMDILSVELPEYYPFPPICGFPYTSHPSFSQRIKFQAAKTRRTQGRLRSPQKGVIHPFVIHLVLALVPGSER